MEFGEIIVNAVEFRDHVPSNTSNKMYMSGGVLYYNGTPSGSYVLPTASASVLGGVKIGSGLSIDGSGVLSATGSAPANMVTTDTAQTITGAKIIGGVTFNNANHDSSLSVEDILTGGGIGADLLWRNAIPNTAVVARAFVALDGGPGEHDVEFSMWTGTGIWTQRTAYASDDLVIGRASEIRGTITPALTLKTSGGTPFRADFAVPLTIASGTPASTANALYNNSGTLYWNGSAVGGSAPSNMVTTDSVQTISGGKTFTSATTMSRLTISSDQPANVSLMRGRPTSGASNANLLVDLYSAWDGSNYSGPALYFGRSNGNGWFTTTPGSFFFSGNGGSGSAENMYFGASTTSVVAAAQCSLVLEVDTQKLFLGGLMSSVSTRKIQSQGGVYVKDTGIEIASDTPASTANTLYNVSGVLHWNGSSVVPANIVTTDTTQTISGAKTFSGSITLSSRTAGQLPYITTGGLISSDAGLSFAQAGGITIITTVGDGAVAANVGFIVDGASGYSKSYVCRTAGVTRWSFGCDNSIETGSDAGSKFFITARTDAGVVIDDVISIIRAAGGIITIGGAGTTKRDVTMTGGLNVTNGVYIGLGTSTTTSPTLMLDGYSGSSFPSIFYRSTNMNRVALRWDNNGDGWTIENRNDDGSSRNEALRIPRTTASTVIAGGTGNQPWKFNGAVTLSASTGLVGVTDGSSAAAGYVGEVIESNIASGSAVTLTSGTNANVTSITLTAGDWEVSGAVNFVTTSATLSLGEGAISGTTATLTTTGQEGFAGPIQTSASTTTGCAVPARRITVSATTTYYLVALANFSGTSCKAYGTIHAQRRR